MAYIETEDFNTVLTAVQDGGRPLFVSGAAGTGKSVLIQYLKDKLGNDIVVCAPTGVAAQNIDGLTIHKLFRIKVVTEGDIRDQAKSRKLASALSNWFKYVVIDEVSMLSADLLDCIDLRLQHSFDPSQPFGGVKVVFVGDLHQLPPTQNQTNNQKGKADYGPVPWYFFKSNAVKKYGFDFLELKKNWRQEKSIKNTAGSEFAAVLNNIRIGENIDESINYINSKKAIVEGDITSNDYLILAATNDIANNHNNTRLGTINGPEISIVGKDDNYIFKFIGGQKNYFKNSKKVNKKSVQPDDLTEDGKLRIPAFPKFTFKLGCRVMLVANQGGDLSDLVNGKLGVIESIQLTDGRKIGADKVDSRDLQFKVGEIERINFRPDGYNKVVAIEPYKWSYNELREDSHGKFRIKQEGSYTQVPFRLGYAVTVHKAQGLTLDKVYIDIEGRAFPALMYVALSRVKTVDGIHLNAPLERNSIEICKEVQNFYKRLGKVGDYESRPAFYKILGPSNQFIEVIERFQIQEDELAHENGKIVLYIGETNNLKRRYECHFLNIYDKGQTESVFRTKIRKLIEKGIISNITVDAFINECSLEVNYCDSKKAAEEKEIEYLEKHLVPLNIKDNQKEELKDLHVFLNPSSGGCRLYRGPDLKDEVNNPKKKKAIVLMCCPRKDGALWRNQDGTNINFVGSPNANVPQQVSPTTNHYANLEQNHFGNPPNQQGLRTARELYRQRRSGENQSTIFAETSEYCNQNDYDFFVFSAGWGIIHEDFPLPMYDLTFSSNAATTSAYRNIEQLGNDQFPDAVQINVGCYEEVHVLCTKEYVTYLSFLLYKQGIQPGNVGNITIHSYAGRQTTIVNSRRFLPNANFKYIVDLYKQANDAAGIGMWDVFWTHIEDL